MSTVLLLSDRSDLREACSVGLLFAGVTTIQERDASRAPERARQGDHLACLVDVASIPNPAGAVRSVLSAAPGTLVITLGALDADGTADLMEAGARATLSLPVPVSKVVDLLWEHHGLTFPRVPESVVLPAPGEGASRPTSAAGAPTVEVAVATPSEPATEEGTAVPPGADGDRPATISDASPRSSTSDSKAGGATGLIERVRKLRQRRRGEGPGSGEDAPVSASESAEIARRLAVQTGEHLAAAAFDDELKSIDSKSGEAESSSSGEGETASYADLQFQPPENDEGDWEEPTRWDGEHTESQTHLPPPSGFSSSNTDNAVAAGADDDAPPPPPPDLDQVLEDEGFERESTVDAAFDAVFTEPTPDEGTQASGESPEEVETSSTGGSYVDDESSEHDLPDAVAKDENDWSDVAPDGDEDAAKASGADGLGPMPVTAHGEDQLTMTATSEGAEPASTGADVSEAKALAENFEDSTDARAQTTLLPSEVVNSAGDLGERRKRLSELHERTRPHESQAERSPLGPSSFEAELTAPGEHLQASSDPEKSLEMAEQAEREIQERVRSAEQQVSEKLAEREAAESAERRALEEDLREQARASAEAVIEARAREAEDSARRSMEERIEAELARQAEQTAKERADLEVKIRAEAEARAAELVDAKTKEAEESARREMEARIAEELSKKAEQTEAESKALEERIRTEAEARAAELVNAKTKEAEESARREMEARISEELSRREVEDARSRAELEERIRREADARTQELLRLQSAEAEEKTRREMEERIARMLEEREQIDASARSELEEKIRDEAEARTQQLLEEKAREAEEKTRREMEERITSELQRQAAETQAARQDLESKIRAEAEARTQQLLEEKAREAEENARRDMELRIAEELSRRQSEDRVARQELEEKIRDEAEARIQELLEEKAREAQEKTRREMDERISTEIARREDEDAAHRAELERQIREEAEARAQTLVQERSAEVEERTRRELEARVGEELERQKAAQDENRAAFEARLREQVEERSQQLLSERVAEAESRLREELKTRTENELAEELSRRDADAEQMRSEIEQRVRWEAETRMQELLQLRITEAEERLKAVGEAQLDEEARRHAEEADRLRDLMELKVKEETEKRAHAAIEARVAELEDEVRRVAETRARELLQRALQVKEEEEARLRQRLSFATGRFDAVGPAEAQQAGAGTVGERPWTDAELLASPIGGQAFAPGGDAPLDPKLTERVIPLEPTAGVAAAGELPALLWSCHFLGVTGKLTLVHPDARRRVLYLEHGEPVAFASDLARDRPEEALLRAGLLTSKRYAEIKAGPTMSARRLCAQLVQDGGIKTDELFTAVRGVLTEQVLSVLEWDKVRYVYEEERAHPEDRVRLVNRFDTLLADGIRRKFDDVRLWQILGGPASIIGPDRRALRLPPLGPGEVAAAKLLDGLRSLEDILLEVPAPAEVILRTALILLACGGAKMLARGLPVDPADRRASEERKVAIDIERVKDRLALARDGDYFAFMGVGPEATTTEVQRAAQNLRTRFDPRRYADPAFNEVRTALVEIQDVLAEAEMVLGDPTLRASYHRRRRQDENAARRAV